MTLLSVIIPVYNRAGLVRRALNSCLSQEDPDFEVVVVDDGSTDDTVLAVESVADPRVRLLRHEHNRGQCPARNTGMAAARGQWFVFLDSDDELLPGAIGAIRRRAMGAPDDVGAMRFMCIDESGLSPDPPHNDEIWDYERYVRWLEAAASGKVETLPCARASTFPAIQYADSHAIETSYHLDLSRAFRTFACSDVVRRYHRDATNQLSVPDPARAVRYAVDDASDLEYVLDEHGDALRRWAPTMYFYTVSAATYVNFVAGRRARAWRHAARAILMRPLSPRTWVTTAVGTISGRVLARLRAAFVARKRKGTT
jgi:glycosyltransferase involved in cell wall biosynthesis